MNFKTKDGQQYLTKNVIDANGYKHKLKLIFCDNEKESEFMYHQVKELNSGKFGILVCGMDTKGVSEFQEFYSCGEINHLFRNLEERLER